MTQTSVRPTDKDIEQVVTQYADTLYRLCLVIIRNEADAADAVQDTFYKYITKSPSFREPEHEKAWLLRVATNISKNYRRFALMHDYIDIETLYDLHREQPEYHLMEAIAKLPPDYRAVIHLHYYEGYTAKEIASILGVSQATALKRLERGRAQIRKMIEEG